MRTATLLALGLCCACSGGGDEFFIDPVQSVAPINEGENAPAPTAQELLQSCITTDLGDFSALLGTLTNLFTGGGEGPTPQLNLLAGLLSGGIIPWTLDLDDDGVSDIGGDIFFKNANGDVTIPFDLGDLLQNGVPENPADLLAELPDGVTLHLTWSFTGLPLSSGNGASGDGELAFAISGGLPNSASGAASLTSGGCTIDFEFTDISIANVAAGSLPQLDATFTLKSGENTVTGTVKFDGTNIAEFTASVNGGPEEIVRLDIQTGQVVP